MNNDKSPSNFKQTVVLVVAAFASVIGLMLFLGFGLLALVAWSDYSDRGCSEAPGQQCDDAQYMMTYPALHSAAGLVFVLLAGWNTLRLFHRLQQVADAR
jgi:hypothetical protein